MIFPFVPGFHTFSPTSPFLETLADLLLSKTSQDPQALSQTLVFLPTRRAIKEFTGVLQKKTKALLLPKILALGEVEHPFLYDVPPALSFGRTYTLLSALLTSLSKGGVFDAGPKTVLDLKNLLEEMDQENVPLENLEHLIPEEFASHLQLSLSFLHILKTHWPEILKAEGRVLASTHRRLLLELQIQAWKENPPRTPIFAAGATGSLPIIQNFLETIRALPQGYVFLPSFDSSLHHAVTPAHPQYALQRLVQKNPVSVVGSPLQEQDQALYGLFHQHSKTNPRDLLRKTAYYQASTDEEEALLIALLLRESLETRGQTACLVTPDQNLAKKVSHALLRWGIITDDSRGQSLGATPLGVLLRRTSTVTQDATPATILEILKHPLVQQGPQRGVFLETLQAFEKKALRQTVLAKTLEDLEGEAPALLKPFFQALMTYQIGPGEDPISLHQQLVETLLGAPLSHELFSFDLLREAIQGIPLEACPPYPILLETILDALQVYPDHFLSHPRIRILGVLEARLMPADFVILGGMNEENWPGNVGLDTWINDTFRKKMGLPLSDQKVGFMAHDFLQAFAAPALIFTRSLLNQGVPTTPSRFLSLLLAASTKTGAPLPHAPWVEPTARSLNVLETPAVPAHRPKPRPPVLLRPTALSITDVTAWVRNPYNVYVKHLLKLKPLEPLEKISYQREFGIMVHEAFQHYLPRLRKNPMDTPDITSLFKAYFKTCPSRLFWYQKALLILDWFQKQIQKEPKNVQDFLEISGTFTVAGFTLKGIADRITLDGHGAHIMDYKTGQVPSHKKMEEGIAPQLSLEALIFQNHGFPGIPPAPLSTLSHWHVHGKNQGGDIVFLKGEPEAWADNALEGLLQLIARYQDLQTPYVATRDSIGSAYDHLARTQEWTHGTV